MTEMTDLEWLARKWLAERQRLGPDAPKKEGNGVTSQCDNWGNDFIDDAPERDGELPPVGCECEYTRPDLNGRVDNRSWWWCYVVAHDRGGAVIRTEKGHYHLRTIPEYRFRPLKSQEQREREEIAALIAETVGYVSGVDGLGKVIDEDSLADALIKAGYRKQY